MVRVCSGTPGPAGPGHQVEIYSPFFLSTPPNGAQFVQLARCSMLLFRSVSIHLFGEGGSPSLWLGERQNLTPDTGQMRWTVVYESHILTARRVGGGAPLSEGPSGGSTREQCE